MARLAIITITAPNLRGMKRGQTITLPHDHPRVEELRGTGKVKIIHREVQDGAQGPAVSGRAGGVSSQAGAMLQKMHVAGRLLGPGELPGFHARLRSNAGLLPLVDRYFGPVIRGMERPADPATDDAGPRAPMPTGRAAQAVFMRQLVAVALEHPDMFTASGIRSIAKDLDVAVPRESSKAQIVEVLADALPKLDALLLEE